MFCGSRSTASSPILGSLSSSIQIGRVADFLGTAQYPCNGYGFVGLYCSLFTGTASIAEKAIKTASCCLDLAVV